MLLSDMSSSLLVFSWHELIEHGAPASLLPLLMLGGRTLQVVAGFVLLFDIYPRLAAVGLLVFLVPTTFVAHSFWQAAGTASFTPQLVNFLKNTAMAGGLLFIGATPSQPALLRRTARSNRLPLSNADRISNLSDETTRGVAGGV